MLRLRVTLLMLRTAIRMKKSPNMRLVTRTLSDPKSTFFLEEVAAISSPSLIQLLAAKMTLIFLAMQRKRDIGSCKTESRLMS